MKRLYLLPFLLFVSTIAFAQKNFEFGFAVKAGNFTIPQKGTGAVYTGTNYSKNALSAGCSTGFGIYGKLALTSCLGLSSGLQYVVSGFHLSEHFDYDPQFEQFMLLDNIWTRHYTEQSLMLPLQLHAALGPSAKTSLTFGMAASFNLATSQVVSSQLTEEERSMSTIAFLGNPFVESRPEKPAPRTYLLFTTGLFRHINAHTSVGIELMVSARPNDFDIYFTSYENRSSSERSPFYMKNLAISLQHNILR